MATQASWIVKRILYAGQWLEERNLQMNEIMEAKEFSIKVMYKELRGEYNKVPWKRLTSNNQGRPAWIFTLYVAIQHRLYTKDRLGKWPIITCLRCSLCNTAPETHQHLFFECSLSRRIWHQILSWLSIQRGSSGCNEELQWAT
ncbi:hypothetical protein KY284_019994 [Solanum tuberosum]|nr:hypothetical protein KY284_019994 [Solanum tuberosum]